ncbi:glycoside hydrolase family 127 protein [Defluviitalea raffinosedens]|uniref:Glycoside hydrolase family 127 protein n=1 Tax=Defluviitalea raffinosedens TaxID=1450156 RepID=A0A7C8LQW3_9FIRM|nr:beta-L-arabinofuranosidase domain-containing protein [Defluviitalea raffinosedens]KAE9636041.1 glycoside hydrolase family 127 protein [Defluviitalea raffinosedens]HHW67412.1 glycoside hydrolase family 127 protein [Candidatus Epulonipiscium sp.]
MNKLKMVPLQNVRIQDSFWDRYLGLVKEVLIPYQWDILNDRLEDVETSHCIKNFKIAAGLESGEFYGAVFQDSDLAKWIEAASYSLAVYPDKDLENTIDEVIDLIEAAQQEDGYINTYFTIHDKSLRFTNLQEGHELYCAGHFMEAAVAYYRATGKDKLVCIMKRFADLICEEFSSAKNSKGYPGHQEVEIGLYKMYEVTGEVKYLKQAKMFLDRRGEQPNYFLEEAKRPGFKRIFDEFKNYDPAYSQSHLPVREQKTAEGHAVRAVYMYSAMADVGAEYDDGTLVAACKRLWDNMVKRRMYITGSIGSSGLLERFTTDYDLPNGSNYSETCASIGLALFGRRMARITRESKYYDVVERALYNTVLSGIAMDGKSFFYVNPLEVWPDHCIPRTSKEHIKPVRQKWFGVACCPPNIARTLASLGEYIYFAEEDAIWVNLFISNKAKFTVNNQELTLDMQTNFPYEGHTRIELKGKAFVKGKIYLRIPDYVKDYKILVDGGVIDSPQITGGYCVLELEMDQRTIDIHFDLTPRFVRANPLVKENIGKVAVMKGPLVYCMEEVDNESNLPAYYIDTSSKLLEYYDKELLGGTVVIKCEGKKVTQEGWDVNQLYSEQKITSEQKMLTFIPYPYWGNRKTGEMLVWVKEML